MRESVAVRFHRELDMLYAILVADLIFSCNAMSSLVIGAVLALLDFLTFACAGCYEFDPSHLKTLVVEFSERRHSRYKGAC